MTALAPRTASVRLATIERIDDFLPLRDEWDRLVRIMPRPSPFLLHAWLTTWWRRYGDSARLAVRVAWRGDRLVAAVPLLVAPRRGVHVTRFIGGRQAALADLLVAEGEDDAAVALGAGLAVRGDADVADLYGLPMASRLAAAVGPGLSVVTRVEAPVLDLDGDWDEIYRAKTTSKKRNLHKRRRRQLGELGRLETTLARTYDELVPALEEAFRLHALRWNGRPDGSGFVTPTGQAFHRDVIAPLADLDAARIALLRLDGRAIAFHYYLVLEGRMYVHRLAFDPALARFSPGLVNTLDAIGFAADEGLTRVEFLGGAERYKVELADRFEPMCHGLGLATSIRGRAYAAAQLGIIDARLRLKRSPTLRSLYVDGLAPVRGVIARSRDALRA